MNRIRRRGPMHADALLGSALRPEPDWLAEVELSDVGVALDRTSPMPGDRRVLQCFVNISERARRIALLDAVPVRGCAVNVPILFLHVDRGRATGNGGWAIIDVQQRRREHSDINRLVARRLIGTRSAGFD